MSIDKKKEATMKFIADLLSGKIATSQLPDPDKFPRLCCDPNCTFDHNLKNETEFFAKSMYEMVVSDRHQLICQSKEEEEALVNEAIVVFANRTIIRGSVRKKLAELLSRPWIEQAEVMVEKGERDPLTPEAREVAQKEMDK